MTKNPRGGIKSGLCGDEIEITKGRKCMINNITRYKEFGRRP